MNRIERILVNVSSNWLGFAINAIITLLLTPYVLSVLGVERYGIWILITSFIGSYGMLDLGFRAGVNQFLIRSIAAEEVDKTNRVLSTALVALAILAVVVFLVALLTALLVPGALDIPDAAREEALYCILIVGAAASIQIALSPYAAIFVAIQRFDISNLISVSMRILLAAAVVFALHSGFGLVGVAAATGGATVAELIIRWFVARRMVPALRPTIAQVSLSELKAIGTFGLWNSLIAVSEYGYAHMLPILVAVFMPVAAVGHYALAAGLWTQLNALFTPIGHVIYPAAAELHVKQERENLFRLYRDGTRILLLVVTSVVLVAFVWADDFYRLWIGPEFLSGDPFTSVSTIFRTMLLATVLGYSVNFAGQILLGAGHIKALAILKASGIASMLGLSALLMPHFGLIAIPVAMAVSILVFDVIGTPIALFRKERLRIDIPSRFGGIRVLAVAAALILLLGSVRELWEPQGWGTLIAQGLIAAALIAPIVLLAGFTRGERRQYFIDPFRRLIAQGR